MCLHLLQLPQLKKKNLKMNDKLTCVDFFKPNLCLANCISYQYLSDLFFKYRNKHAALLMSRTLSNKFRDDPIPKFVFPSFIFI